MKTFGGDAFKTNLIAEFQYLLSLLQGYSISPNSSLKIESALGEQLLDFHFPRRQPLLK
jgi:hypothetical protein